MYKFNISWAHCRHRVIIIIIIIIYVTYIIILYIYVYVYVTVYIIYKLTHRNSLASDYPTDKSGLSQPSNNIIRYMCLHARDHIPPLDDDRIPGRIISRYTVTAGIIWPVACSVPQLLAIIILCSCTYCTDNRNNGCVYNNNNNNMFVIDKQCCAIDKGLINRSRRTHNM